MDLIASATGADALDRSFKATCCGAGIGIPKKEIGLALMDRLLTGATACGAHAVVVCCPLCRTNLDLHQPKVLRKKGMNFPRPLPILYYTELLGIAFGLDSVRSGFKCHFVNPTPLLKGRCRACEKTCPVQAVCLESQAREWGLEAGAVVLSGGFEPALVPQTGEYGHGRYAKVVTALEYERMLSATGPFGGHLRGPSDRQKPRRTAWI
ncbi:MAG TPA: heterodisulfide reductase-related iron-sulfur binding cluster [Syntrophobacteraceae bacterium]|nr:heterodisulfide reductase-related iron-sulfur binding cluster [Syntrophobacteraceae bacterium]